MTTLSRDSAPEVEELGSARLRALGIFFENRPDRIRSVAAQLQQSGRVIESRVEGSCMGRCLPDRSSIRIRLCREESFAPGQIVAFLNETRLTVHRVHFSGSRGRRKGMLVTRGDARAFPDPPLAADSVLGVVVGVESEGRWIDPPPAESLPWHKRALSWASIRVIAAFGLAGVGFARAATIRSYTLLGRVRAPSAGVARTDAPRVPPRSG
jgi:hypothetical protein